MWLAEQRMERHVPSDVAHVQIVEVLPEGANAQDGGGRGDGRLRVLGSVIYIVRALATQGRQLDSAGKITGPLAF